MGDMTRLLLLWLWVGVAVSTPVDLQKRIIRGQTCDNQERLNHVKFVNRTNNNLICGGSLISENWILTAAHCWKRDIEPVLGLHPDPRQEKRGAILTKRIFTDQSDHHDIMLLKLRNPVTTITPVKLPDCKNPPARGAMVQVAGYGATTLGPKGRRKSGESNTLQCVELEIVNDSFNCPGPSNYFKEYGKSHYKLYQSAGKDTSAGDSGGGVVSNGMIYGVHAFTFDGTQGCVAKAGFVDVCEYKQWIQTETGQKFPN